MKIPQLFFHSTIILSLLIVSFDSYARSSVSKHYKQRPAPRDKTALSQKKKSPPSPNRACPSLTPTITNAYTVTNTADSGTGSLRQAIINSNANPPTAGQLNAINFNITPGTGPFTIAPLSALPHITQPVFTKVRT